MNIRLGSATAAALLVGAVQPGFAGPPAGHAGSLAPAAMGAGMHPAPMTPPMHPSPAMSNSGMQGGTMHTGQAKPEHEAASHADAISVLDQNAKLNDRLRELVPAGSTPRQACDGFANLGGCVAALHVASNLDIPFAELKTRMTGPGSTTLGDAIHELKPDANAGRAQRKAERQAHRDLRAAGEE